MKLKPYALHFREHIGLESYRNLFADRVQYLSIGVVNNPSYFKAARARAIRARFQFHILWQDREIQVEKLTGRPAALESEQDFKGLFPECAVGAMPPLGNLFGLQTYVDESLAQQDYIVFEAGTHTDAIKLNYRDYERIVRPQVAKLTL